MAVNTTISRKNPLSILTVFMSTYRSSFVILSIFHRMAPPNTPWSTPGNFVKKGMKVPRKWKMVLPRNSAASSHDI